MFSSPGIGNRTQTQVQSQTPAISGADAEPRLFQDYTLNPRAWDELFASPGQPHDFCRVLLERLGGLSVLEFLDRRTSADLVFINNGITFSVYSDRRGTEKIFPFDLIP